jgi:hypothetical protein
MAKSDRPHPQQHFYRSDRNCSNNLDKKAIALPSSKIENEALESALFHSANHKVGKRHEPNQFN